MLSRFSGWRILASGGAQLAVPADTTEDTLVSVVLPANSLNPNGAIRVTQNWSMTNSANNKSGRIRLGGNSLCTWTATVQDLFREYTIIMARGVNNSQVSSRPSVSDVSVLGQFGGGGAYFLTTKDLTVDNTLLITGQKASAGESMILDSYIIEIFQG